MISLEKEMIKLIKDDKDYLLVRHFKEIKCNCWRKESQTPNLNCPRCFGSGWIFTEFVHECKFQMISLARVSHTQDFDYGKTYSNILTAYLPITEKSLLVKLDDLIYVMENYPVPNKKIVRKSKWMVTDVFILHSEQNKPEFVKIICKPIPV